MIISKRDFAARCGVSTRELAVYIKRGKVIVQGEDVDTEDSINVEFADRKTMLKDHVKIPKAKPVKVKKVKKKTGTKPKKIKVDKSEYAEDTLVNQESEPSTIPESPFDQEKRDKLIEKYDLDVEKKKAEIVRLNRDSELMNMKHQKLLGKLIPTDVVKSLFAQHFKSVTVNFKQAVDVLLTEINKKAKLNRNDMAHLKGSLISVINKSIDSSIQESKNGLKNIITEYSQNQKAS